MDAMTMSFLDGLWNLWPWTILRQKVALKQVGKISPMLPQLRL